jgi:hypothetical protein
MILKDYLKNKNPEILLDGIFYSPTMFYENNDGEFLFLIPIFSNELLVKNNKEDEQEDYCDFAFFVINDTKEISFLINDRKAIISEIKGQLKNSSKIELKKLIDKKRLTIKFED